MTFIDPVSERRYNAGLKFLTTYARDCGRTVEDVSVDTLRTGDVITMYPYAALIIAEEPTITVLVDEIRQARFVVFEVGNPERPNFTKLTMLTSADNRCFVVRNQAV
jgi:hypothetical protein